MRRGFEPRLHSIGMRTLLEAEPLAPVSKTLSQAADQLRGSNTTILLLAAPSLQGALAIAPLEAALIDAGLPYRRRFRLEAPSDGSWVHILGPADESGPRLSLNPLQLSLSGTVVEGLTGHQGDSRKGPLTAVAQSHALAQAICPDGARICRLRPWAISGNWLHSALDTTYDPVFTALRDALVQDGSIKVVPLPEVPEPNISASTWIDPAALDAITSRWPSLDMEGRARALSHLMRPALSRSTPSTARLEEIGWHCVLGPGWSTDLAGQITSAAGMWKENPAAVAAGRVTDSLLRRGVIPRL